MLAWLALLFVLGEVRSSSAQVDASTVEVALELRSGKAAAPWTVEISDGEGTAEVRAVLRHEYGREVTRSFALASTTTEERSRELAAALSLVIDQQPPVERPPTVRPPPLPRKPQGWLTLGFRVAAGRPAHVTGGPSVRGGVAWRHVQVLGSLATVHARRGDLAIDGFRLGGGAAFGAPVGRWWLGGDVVPHVQLLVARDRGRDRGLSSVTEVAGLAMLHHRNLVVALRAGVELTAPPVRAAGEGDALRLGTLRFLAGIEVGLRLPPRSRT
ncbi:MAG: hypothetical protein K1X88_10525 [Nannocystaceae bacterium]|nr:hypothetical protein [Nannocystaceae bacterium]